MVTSARIAVLGAGMLGTCVALLLARRGISVSIFDAEPDAMSCAARWNEGKIHQGYTYSADPSLGTAKKLLPGSASFENIVSSLLETQIDSRMTREPDLILTHAGGVVGPVEAFEYYRSVWALSQEAGLTTRPPERLSRQQMQAITDHPSIVAGYRVPERSIDTNWIADQLSVRLRSEPHIECRFGQTVSAVYEDHSQWTVATDLSRDGGFRSVVNALWQGRGTIDAAVGLPLTPLSYRYRVSIFARVPQCTLPNILIATGGFGDIKNYDGKSIYLSWYPAGLVVDHMSYFCPGAPDLTEKKRQDISQESLRELAKFFPAVADLPNGAKCWKLRGGWVVAPNGGPLSDPSSGLHKRDSFGWRHLRNYISVDAGKYSMAPYLAEKVAEEISG
jgi:glycine/D-amino acid oxidase-like deaminating enzyme